MSCCLRLMMAGAEGFEPPSFASEARHLECRVLPLHHAPIISKKKGKTLVKNCLLSYQDLI